MILPSDHFKSATPDFCSLFTTFSNSEFGTSKAICAEANGSVATLKVNKKWSVG